MDAVLQELNSPVFGPVYALVAGLLTSASPCTLAALPLVVGHLSGSTRRERLRDLVLFILGMTLALTLSGVVAGALGRSLIFAAPWIRWVAGVAFITGGAAYMGLFGNLLTCEVPLAGKEGGGISEARSRLPRSLAGVAVGALYGLSASPCSTPALIAILALVATTGSIAKSALLLLFYSLGQSFLVAVAGLATSSFRAFLENGRRARALDLLRKAGGAAIVVFGVYILIRPYI
jgi:cytochrome c biogenesis protein CcdA